MNEVAINGDNRMTVREVADALGYQPDTIQGKVKELFPKLVKNGITTRLTLTEVDIIKQNLVPRNLGLKSEVESAITPLDIERMTVQVMQYHIDKIAELQARVDRLIHDDRTFTTGELAKEIGMKSAQELNQALLTKGISYKDARGVWLLHSQYAGKGLQRIKDKEVNGKVVYYAEWTGIGRDWLLGVFSAK